MDGCPFTGGRCDGGEIHPDGTIGCAFKREPSDECEWTAELPEGASPRDRYNELMMEAME